LRVTMRVEDLVRGGNLETHEVEGIGDSSLFSMVEKLTHLVKVDLGLSARADTRLDRHLRDVTTSSVEAYRLYAEGMQLRFQTFRFEDAILFLEKAVAIDSGFALALAQLGIWHGNLSRPKEMEAYLAEAVQHLDRVTTRERYYIEACYYSTREITIAKEIEAYRRLLELYPEDIARHNLANCYAYLERFPEAIEELEEVRRRGLVVHNYELAHAYASLGQIDRGLQALEDALSFHANRWEIHRNIGLLHTWAGRYEEAVQAFDRADVLSPGEEHIAYGRWEIAALRGEWEDAGAYAGEMTLSAEPYWTWRGFRSQAWNHLYRGRSADALDSLERAALAYGDDGPFSGFARSLKSHVLVETAQLEKAIEEARRAQELGEGHVPEWQGLFFEGLAQARLGRFEDARKTAQKLRRRTEPIPGNREKRRWHHLSGEIALAAGEHEQAIGELEKARSLLPPRGLHWPRGRLNDHVPVWYSLASAYVAAGDEEEALHFFSRIAESGYEHLYWPIPYVRSLSFLASIHENRGELEKARKLRERFANYWGGFTDMTSLPLPERSTATQ
ncbi:MAG TPA: tetratricopeptide repeat protein, partial [Vicinamibacteria bacterium]|nr:tetratricopeptide repeat protein [Vicinamibacteria bacterium]